MAKTMKKLTQADIEAMSIDTGLELQEAVWDSLTASLYSVAVPQWHKDIIDNRLAKRNVVSDSWENVTRRLGQ